jgi:hypothetical protein
VLFSGTGMADSRLADLLQDIDGLLSGYLYTGDTGLHSYRLAYDADFPCSVTFTEQNLLAENQWTRRYRVELQDLEPGHLVTARDNRRAISYYSEKNHHDNRSVYAPKKIAAFGIKVPADWKGLTPLQTALDEAIALCAEQYLFLP